MYKIWCVSVILSLLLFDPAVSFCSVSHINGVISVLGHAKYSVLVIKVPLWVKALPTFLMPILFLIILNLQLHGECSLTVLLHSWKYRFIRKLDK